MSSKSVEKEINDLHALVSNFDPNESSGDGYVEIIEAPIPKSKVSAPKPVKPVLPPPTKLPNILERTFSFNGVTNRSYFFWNTIIFLVLSAGVISLIDADEMNVRWGILALGMMVWSLLANLAKRWRDTGYNMRWLLTLLIPYANLVTILFLLFAPSKRGP
jgi:hypothetical protein